MSKRPIIVAVLVVLAAGGGAAWVACTKSEPSFQNVRLSSWVAQLSSLNASEQRAHAEEAIRKIGPEAIPTLRKWLRTRDTQIKNILEEWLSGIVRFTPASEEHSKACTACEILGPTARPLEMDLIQLLQRDEDGCDAASALATIRTEMISPLVTALTNESSHIC